MPFIYDPRLSGSGYRDTATGRIISRANVGEQVDVMISVSSDVTLSLSEMVDSGGISAQSWKDAMRQEIKDNYITQYMVGRGGRENMTQADWGSIGGMISDQYRYLDGFYSQVAGGQLSQAQIYARSRMYLNSSREAYERAQGRAAGARGFTEHGWFNSPVADTCDDCKTLQAQGWIPIDKPFISPSTGAETLPGMGDTICLTNCHCHVDYGGKRLVPEFMTFDTMSEAQAYLDSLRGPIDAAFVDFPADAYGGGGGPEVQALSSYVGDGYVSINNSLRRSNDPDALAGVNREIGALDDLFGRSEAILPDSITVWRSFGPKFFDDKPVGTIFTDNAYTSTSINPDFERYGWAVAEVEVPAGIRAVSGQAVSYKRSEMEVLLERGLSFEVVENNDIDITVRVLQ